MRKSLQILLNWPSGESPWRAAGPQLRSLSRSLSEHHWRGNAHRPSNAPGRESHDFGLYLVLVLLLHPHPTHDSNHPPPASHSYPVMLWNSPASISVSWDHFSECSWWLHLQCGGNKTQERLGQGHGDSSIHAWVYRSRSIEPWKVLEHRGRMSESNLNYGI